MTMNRNDFAALAEFAKGWRSTIEQLCEANYLSFCQDLADTCKSRAPDFIHSRFFKACEAPVCPLHGGSVCLDNYMGVLWCTIANQSIEKHPLLSDPVDF